MKLALIGYGKMGQMMEKIALSRGHEIVARLTSQQKNWPAIQTADVCLEFSRPECVMENVRKIASYKKNIVIGTTGWDNQIDEVRRLAEQTQIGIVYSPNFSLGIQLLQNILQNAAKTIKPFSDYDAAGVEYHHQAKQDSPSGTALLLAKTVDDEMNRLKKLVFSSVRCGSIPGTHSILFDSPCDTITITHTARNREGFAKGAVLAAEWLAQKKGFYPFSTCVQELIQQGTV